MFLLDGRNVSFLFTFYSLTLSFMVSSFWVRRGRANCFVVHPRKIVGDCWARYTLLCFVEITIDILRRQNEVNFKVAIQEN